MSGVGVVVCASCIVRLAVVEVLRAVCADASLVAIVCLCVVALVVGGWGVGGGGCLSGARLMRVAFADVRAGPRRSTSMESRYDNWTAAELHEYNGKGWAKHLAAPRAL